VECGGGDYLIWADNDQLFSSIDVIQKFKFLELKDRGGLIRPNKGVVKVIEIADRILNEETKISDIFSQVNIFKKLTIKALSVITEQFPSVLADLDDHGPAQKGSHKADIIKQISSMYISMKIKHLCKLHNTDQNSFSRHMNKKLTLFRHE